MIHALQVVVLHPAARVQSSAREAACHSSPKSNPTLWALRQQQQLLAQIAQREWLSQENVGTGRKARILDVQFRQS